MRRGHPVGRHCVCCGPLPPEVSLLSSRRRMRQPNARAPVWLGPRDPGHQDLPEGGWTAYGGRHT